MSDTEIGKVGGLICWENYMPAARLALYQKGIEIYVAPNADDLPSWTATMQHIAKEGRCFVINCNQFCKVTLSCPFPFLFFPSSLPPLPTVLPPSRKLAITIPRSPISHQPTPLSPPPTPATRNPTAQSGKQTTYYPTAAHA